MKCKEFSKITKTVQNLISSSMKCIFLIAYLSYGLKNLLERASMPSPFLSIQSNFTLSHADVCLINISSSPHEYISEPIINGDTASEKIASCHFFKSTASLIGKYPTAPLCVTNMAETG